MDLSPYWSIALTLFGILGFFLAGKKIWWAWYVNIANQVVWTIYAIISDQWGFLVGAGFYFIVFGHNAYQWMMEHLGYEKEPFCTECMGPYKQRHYKWLRDGYGGHWDTCPNAVGSRRPNGPAPKKRKFIKHKDVT